MKHKIKKKITIELTTEEAFALRTFLGAFSESKLQTLFVDEEDTVIQSIIKTTDDLFEICNTFIYR